MESSVQTWRRRWPVAYGAVELKRFYNRYLTRGFVLSTIINLLLVGVYWGYVWSHPEPARQPTIRIVAYNEFVVPSTTTRSLGLTAYPILPIAEDNSFSLNPSQPFVKPKGAQTIRPTLPPRNFAQNLGDLPSALPGDRSDASAQAADEQSSFNGGTVGGGNENVANNVQGGYPVIGSDGDVPSGPARSGIGSAAKPIPGGSSYVGGEPYGTTDGTDGGHGFSMKWLQGGTRKKIGGDVPKYPAGVRVEAELVFYAVVDPDGSIRNVLPAQKGDTRLESAVTDELRFWKFEPLPSSFPQVDQTCVLTFLFKLK